MNPIFLTLSVLDVVAGFTLVLSKQPGLLVKSLGLFSLLKGGWSLMSSFSANYYFDWMGWLDLVTGACLLLTSFNIVFGFYSVVGLIQVMKGVYSAARCL